MTTPSKVKDYSAEDDLSPVVSNVIATVTEAIADAAKSAVDELATAFCDVAVPEFLAPIEAIELDIPILGEFEPLSIHIYEAIRQFVLLTILIFPPTKARSLYWQKNS